MVEGNGGCPSSLDAGTCVLYGNSQSTIALIDVPRSIALGQGSKVSTRAAARTLISSEPRKEPYPSLEPKSEKARANVLRQVRLPSHEPYSSLITRGLEEIRQHHHGSWCLARAVTAPRPSRGPKRRKRSSPSSSSHSDYKLTSGLQNHPKRSGPTSLRNGITFTSVQDINNMFLFNGGLDPVNIEFPSSTNSMTVPEGSAFFQSQINKHTAALWSEAVLHHFPTPTGSAGPGQFDFILLDPPWENRSVRNSTQYETADRSGPTSVLKEHLHRNIAPAAVVACWVTNSERSRAAALDLFEAWNVRLTEEWVWLKVTADGRPLYDIDGLWRRPYEILLVGRERGDKGASSIEASDGELKRRLLVAVPDLHSRKPCLKELVEPMMLNMKDYRALEVFARNLTAGWCAWGNEACKFNFGEHWTKTE